MGDESVREEETRPVLRNSSSISMDISIGEASAMFPGFRFSPTDKELIRFYLKRKLEGSEKDVEVIPEVHICRHEPWDLPAQAVIPSDNEWFFFSPRGKKYPNGSQSKRATKSGYWKATGKERSIKSGPDLIGTKRTLVFHTGRAPKGQRTEWLMHEFCASDKSQDAMVVCRLRRNSEFQLTENSKRNPMNQEDLAPDLSGGEHSGMLEGPKLTDGHAKECNSYTSHSVEQTDCGSESDERPANGLSQHDSSSQKKNYTDDDDWYADIMKDDIIKLDDTASAPVPLAMPLSAVKLKPKAKSEQPPGQSHIQGSANRRLRLRRYRLKSFRSDRFEALESGENGRPTEKDSVSGLSCVIDKTALSRINVLILFVFLVLIIFLLAYKLFTGDPLRGCKSLNMFSLSSIKN